MLLRQLEGFVETSREGSISRAAAALFISQPALTARLKALERQLGTDLLVRTQRGVKLTASGRAFLPYAKRALEAVADGRYVLEELRDGAAGLLVLATPPAISTYVLPPMLHRFRLLFPDVHVSVRTGHPDEVLDLVLHEQVHLGLGCDLEHPELTPVHLYDDELVLTAAPDHAFTHKRTISMADLAGEQLIMVRTASFGDAVASIFGDARFEPRHLMELDNIDAAKKMVEHGLGVAFLPRIAIAEELDRGRLACRRVRELGVLERRIVAVRRRDAGESFGAVAHFLSAAVVHGSEPASDATTVAAGR